MIEEYNKITENIVKNFVKRFYEEDNEEMGDYRLMDHQGIITGPLELCDRYFDLEDILICEKFKIPTKILIDFHDEKLEAYFKNETLGINFFNYWRKKENLEKYKKEEKESLEKSQKKCEEIKNIFLECLKSNQKIN